MALIGNQLSSAENNSYRVLDNLASFTLTFDGSSSANVLASTDTIALSQHPFVTGQRVTYSSGGGSPIGGLLSGTAYYITKTDQNSFKLASSYVNAITNINIDLVGTGTGVTHSFNVAFDGVNTKFKATYSNGTKCTISRAAQLDIAINGVVQQPYDSNPPPNGFTIEADATIVFSTPPLAGYTFWGKALSGSTASFEISDNSIDNFTGNGSTTNFTLSKTPANSQNVLVTINGVTQYPSDATGTRSYSTNANVLVFTAPPANGSLIQVRYIGFAGPTSSNVTGFYGRTGNVVLNSSDGIGVGTAKIGTGIVGLATALLVEGNVRITGILTIGTGSITLDGNSSTISGVTQSNVSNTNVTGIATFSNGPVLIGTGTSTGTSTQRLQVTGGGYVSGSVGIGVTNPLGRLSIYTTSINTATDYYGENFGIIIGKDNGDNLNDEGNGIVFTQQYAADGVDSVQIRVGAIVGYKGQATGNFGGGLKFKVQPTGATPMVDAMILTKDSNLAFNSGYGSAATAYGCRAWVNFNGTTASPSTIRGSGNVSSVTKNGTGVYTLNFTTAMPDANYSTAAQVKACGIVGGLYVEVIGNSSCGAPTASSTALRVITYAGAVNDSDYIYAAVFR
jgi:hypothetical protein